MKISAIKCLNCNDIIYSRAQHDFMVCSCAECYIDGGQQYMRIGFGNAGYEFIDLNIPEATEKILYDDWNLGKNRYGKIKQKD